jgi:hypothetical protein
MHTLLLFSRAHQPETSSRSLEDNLDFCVLDRRREVMRSSNLKTANTPLVAKEVHSVRCALYISHELATERPEVSGPLSESEI